MPLAVVALRLALFAKLLHEEGRATRLQRLQGIQGILRKAASPSPARMKPPTPRKSVHPRHSARHPQRSVACSLRTAWLYIGPERLRRRHFFIGSERGWPSCCLSWAILVPLAGHLMPLAVVSLRLALCESLRPEVCPNSLQRLQEIPFKATCVGRRVRAPRGRSRRLSRSQST